MKIKAVNEIYYYDFARSFQLIEIKLLLLFKNVVIFLLKNMSGLLYGNIRGDACFINNPPGSCAIFCNRNFQR